MFTLESFRMIFKDYVFIKYLKFPDILYMCEILLRADKNIRNLRVFSWVLSLNTNLINNL